VLPASSKFERNNSNRGAPKALEGAPKEAVHAAWQFAEDCVNAWIGSFCRRGGRLQKERGVNPTGSRAGTGGGRTHCNDQRVAGNY
jgi:hypothetical protein